MATDATASGGAASALPYRPCVGVVLANADGAVFIAERIDTEDAWQMPQGGIDAGEAPRVAALRELEEEIGVGSDLVRIEAEHPDWLCYDLPDHLIGKVWGGRWRGQRQRWFLMRFLGADDDIDLAVAHPEFRRWRWAHPDEALAEIVPFKQAIYREVLSYFGPFLGAGVSGNGLSPVG